MKMWNKRYELTPSRKSNTWYFSIYLRPSFEFQIKINKWTVGIWIFGVGVAFEKFPFWL